MMFDGRAGPFDDATAAFVAIKTKHPRRLVRSLDQFIREFPDTTARDRAHIEDALQYMACVTVIPTG
jgi:hypothetical protein